MADLGADLGAHLDADLGTEPGLRLVPSAGPGDVSVVIATHLVERYDQLLAALDSVHAQSLPPREVIVVVDGCAEVGRRLTERAGPEQVLVLPTNRGLSAVRNAGVARARGRWVAFLDDDAVAERDWLARLLAGCHEAGGAGAGGASRPDFAGGRSPRWFPEELYWTVGCSYRGLPERTTQVRNVFGGCALLRRDLFELTGGFDEQLGRHGGDAAGGEEADFCLRASAADPSVTFLHVPDAVILHRVPAERATPGYVWTRCHHDGRAKARIARAGRALASEQQFLLTVPAAVLRHLRAGRPAAAVVLVLGVAAAAVGYLQGRLSRS